MTSEFYVDALKRSTYRNMRWYNEHLIKALNMQKERRVRDIDTTIAMAEELKKILNEIRPQKVVVPLPTLEHHEDDSLMKPIEPEVLDILYGSQEKGALKKYLKKRYTKSPEDKFFFRVCSNWDYGWQQSGCKQARLVNYGRTVVTQTFYRRNNVAPDAPNYPQPAGAMPSMCSAEYSCYFN